MLLEESSAGMKAIASITVLMSVLRYFGLHSFPAHMRYLLSALLFGFMIVKAIFTSDITMLIASSSATIGVLLGAVLAEFFATLCSSLYLWRLVIFALSNLGCFLVLRKFMLISL